MITYLRSVLSPSVPLTAELMPASDLPYTPEQHDLFKFVNTKVRPKKMVSYL